MTPDHGGCTNSRPLSLKLASSYEAALHATSLLGGLSLSLGR